MLSTRTAVRRLTQALHKSALCLTLLALPLAAQQYQPTVASLDKHPLPDWYADAKLGIFIHWGLYSIPGWAPPKALPSTATTEEQIASDGYAEWYYNTMRIPGSPTSRYHHEHYNDANYYDFTAAFNRETKKWSPDAMAATFRMAGARYVVLTSKHHEGFTLWPSKVVNPNQKNLSADRDIVGELTTSVRNAGLKMGLYYSGGYDWTFNRGPIETSKDFDTVKPENNAYGQYADAQAEELIARYHPSILWNDIDWPKSGDALKVMADYYNAVPDGVVDDRFGVPHSDFTSPEYAKLDTIQAKKWEECRGLGRSFGYNRAEGEAETIAPAELIALLVDIVSKNGNLLLDVGPEADGTIPPVQMDRLVKLGEWLKQNGDAIYGTRPWTPETAKLTPNNKPRAEGQTADGTGVRFTTKGNKLYAILLARPASSAIVLKDVSAKPGSVIHLLGVTAPLTWTTQGSDLDITLPQTMPGNYSWVLKIESTS